MPTSFFTGAGTDVKESIDGVGERDNRYAIVNSRNRNRKVIRAGATISTQFLGISTPTAAPTGTPGSGGALFYCYVYVNKKFTDPNAAEDDPYIRSNRSPSLSLLSQGGAPTNIIGTVSTDPQVTHLWLYVGSTSSGPFFRLSADYEVANTGTPTWANGVTTVPTDFALETDNFVTDTARMVCESNGFFSLGGYVPQTGTANATIGSATISSIAGATMYDGVLALYFQFPEDTTGGPSNDGIHIANYVSSTSLQLVDADGNARTYDGPGNKTAATFRLWRDDSIIQITKRWNPDFTPGLIDPDFLIRGNGKLVGIAKPTSGYALRYHYNSYGKKSVEIADFTQGVPPRRFLTASPYAMSNPTAYTNAGHRMFYWDTEAGCIEDKGQVHIPVTIAVIPNLVRSLNKSAAAVTEMSFDESRHLMFISVAPSGYTKGYYLIVYNIKTNTWNLWFMLPDVNCMRRILNTSTGIVQIYMGSSNGSVTTWPSANFNEAVGTSQVGTLSTTDDVTHLTVVGTPFPTSGDKLKDRWVMVWNDALTDTDIPVYQFARISDNTNQRLTLDTFIGPNSTVQLDPVPATGWAYWVGPIQSIIGPNWDFNSIPDTDGHITDISATTSGLEENHVMRLGLYRNFETDVTTEQYMSHVQYNDSTTDPDHQVWRAGKGNSIEATGVTGWRITDNNEAGLSMKVIVKRVHAIAEALNRPR